MSGSLENFSFTLCLASALSCTSVKIIGTSLQSSSEEANNDFAVENIAKLSEFENLGRDPFNQNSNWSDREKRTTSKGGPVFSKLFRLDRTDPLSFGPKFPEILVEWIAPLETFHDFLME